MKYAYVLCFAFITCWFFLRQKITERRYCTYHLVIDYYGSFKKLEVLHSWCIHLHGQMQYFMYGPMMQYLTYIVGLYIMYVVENGEDFTAKQRDVK